MTLSVTHVDTPWEPPPPAAVPRREHPVKRTLASTALIRAGCWCARRAALVHRIVAWPFAVGIDCVRVVRPVEFGSLAAAGGEETPLAVAWLPEPGVVTHQVALSSVAPASPGASERPPCPRLSSKPVAGRFSAARGAGAPTARSSAFSTSFKAATFRAAPPLSGNCGAEPRASQKPTSAARHIKRLAAGPGVALSARRPPRVKEHP